MKYEKYKPSGIDWIGDLPEHWEIKKLKNILLRVNSGEGISNNEIDEDGEFEIYGGNGVMGYTNKFNSEGEVIVIGRVGAKCGVTYLLNQKLWISDNALQTRTYQNYMYLYYLLVAIDFNQYANQNAQPLITGTIVKNFAIPFIKNKSEQLAIANYLDEQTQKIDRLIANKKAQAEKLKELRQIEINNAVTKGLNLKVEMKDSGIEWLGEIPKHWEVKRLKNFTTKIGSGVTPKGGSEVYEDSGIPIFRSQNIHFDGLRLDDVAYINEQIHNSMSGSKVEPNDVLLNITGASIGRCFYYDGSLGEANVNQHVCIIRTNKKLSHLFLHWFLSSDSGQSQIFMGQVGTSREGLTFQDIKNITFALPPITEQMSVANYLKQRIVTIDKLIKNNETQIEQLQELRKVKIYEAVTGKIKVDAYAEATA